MNYKFNEDKILNTIKSYIGNTYNQHYANGKYQATDMIVDSGHGEGFCMGNIMKYAMRYGKKEGHNDTDLYKIVHYAIIAIHLNDKEQDDG
jgi:K+-transporting ATPase A subunit